MNNILQKIAEDLIDHHNHRVDLYNEIDLTSFSSKISLFPYQQEALKNVVAILDLYFSDKIKLKNYYELRGFDEKKYVKENLTINKILNRASFWMATGSGKSIVMIKLIEILYTLVRKNYIPQKDILILAPTDKILDQVLKHIHEFNRFSNTQIELHTLKDYEKIKNENLFTHDQMRVFYYRSDLIDNESNVSKKNDGKRLNYENYLNNGQWYIILDEAHKGQAELSLKKNYYNEMAQNGYIFNFSATFVDSIDKLSTVYNFNLAKFNEAGYGKNIKIVDEEYKGFNKKEGDFSASDKKDTIVKSCILFSAIKKQYQSIKKLSHEAYHDPLMITVANTVNIKNADLKLYFLTLLEVAKQEPENFIVLKDELKDKLQSNRHYIFGDDEISDELIESLDHVSYQDILKYVFNSESNGVIECKKTASKDELLFKIKTSSIGGYFALLKISDINGWSNGILYGYDISEDIGNESYFDAINKESSTINILMGSKIFSEGWDSNRPNIINFLNIGSKDARKYVMQTVGRGVRIEPTSNSRMRLNHLNFEESQKIANFNQWVSYSNGLESLFIFATSKNDVETIFKELPTEEEKFEKLNGIRKNQKIAIPLYIPKYKRLREKEAIKYNFPQSEYTRIQRFINASSENVILMHMIDKTRTKDLAKKTISKLVSTDSLKYFILNGHDDSKIDEIDLINKIDKFFNAKLEEVDEFVELSNEIKHYREIKVNMKKISSEQKRQIEEDISNSTVSIDEKKQFLKNQLDQGKISLDEYTDEIMKIGSQSVRTTTRLVEIKHLKEHFYMPILMKDKNENDIFRNIINEPSEIEFINALEKYLAEEKNHFKQYDHWYFSKIQQNTDDIFIPYVDYEKSTVAKFYPDFIFWLKQGKQYFIKFIDPKGIKQGTHKTKDKVDGYESIFLTNEFKDKFPHFSIELYFYSKDRLNNESIDKYVEFDFEKIFFVN